MDTSNERANQGDQGATASTDSFWRPVETPAAPTESVPTAQFAVPEAPMWEPVESFAGSPTASMAESGAPGASDLTSFTAFETVSPISDTTASPAPTMTSAFGLTAPSFADSSPDPTRASIGDIDGVQPSAATPAAPMMAAGLSGLSGFSAVLSTVAAPDAPTFAPPPEAQSFQPAPTPSFSPVSSVADVDTTSASGTDFEPVTPASFAPASFESGSFEPLNVPSSMPSVPSFSPVAEFSSNDNAAEYPSQEFSASDSGEHSPAMASAAVPGFDPVGSGFDATPSWSAAAAPSDAAKPTLGSLTAAAALLTPAVEEGSSRFSRLKKAKASDEFGAPAKPAKTEKVKKVKKSKEVDAGSLLSSRPDESGSAPEAPKAKRFSRGEKAAKSSDEFEGSAPDGSARRKFIVPGAMALVGLLGGGGYVLMSGGAQTAAPVPAPAVAVPASEAAPSGSATTESTVPSADGVPPDLALTDPAAPTGDPFGADELEIEAPIAALEFDEPIPALDPAASTETTVPASAAVPNDTVPTDPVPAEPATADPAAASEPVPTEPAVAVATDASATAPVAAPVSAGRFKVASCVSVVGEVNDRTHRVSNATITETDCAAAHNSEIVSEFTPDQNCETAVISFVGYPSRIKQLDGTVVAFALVQDKSDGRSYCVASFPTMPDYTGQLFGSKTVQ
jgi:hypothetical protein